MVRRAFPHHIVERGVGSPKEHWYDGETLLCDHVLLLHDQQGRGPL
jgi:hypothetical protein